jgi:hypothetical protein
MKIVNLLLFNLNWFACVIGGAAWGSMGLIALLTYSAYVGSWRTDIRLALSLAVCGWIVDSLWIYFGVLDYGTAYAPVWIVMLWVGLAFTLNHSMSPFISKPLIGGLAAAVAAPLTYLSGAALGAVNVLNATGILLISLVWCVLFFGIFRYLQLHKEKSASLENGKNPYAY